MKHIGAEKQQAVLLFLFCFPLSQLKRKQCCIFVRYIWEQESILTKILFPPRGGLSNPEAYFLLQDQFLPEQTQLYILKSLVIEASIIPIDLFV